MSQQPGTSRLPVALAAFFLVAAVGAFGVSFVLFDGATVAEEVLGGLLDPAGRSAVTTTTPTVDDDKLQLPDGMNEEFALRLWQEQLDSQEMIGRLASGEIRSLRVDRIAKNDDEAQLFVTVRFQEPGEYPGVLGLRRFGDDWYIASATSNSGDGPSSTPLPDIEDVDVPLLNAMIAENRKSQPVIAEYLSGNVRQVIIEELVAGPRTVTMSVVMEEGHGEAYANLVAVKEDVGGNPAWFLARFTKTGHNPPEL